MGDGTPLGPPPGRNPVSRTAFMEVLLIRPRSGVRGEGGIRADADWSPRADAAILTASPSANSHRFQLKAASHNSRRFQLKSAVRQSFGARHSAGS